MINDDILTTSCLVTLVINDDILTTSCVVINDEMMTIDDFLCRRDK